MTASNSFAIPITFEAFLNGASEVPSNPSPGVGFALVSIDSVAHTLAVSATFSGLTGTTTASHIHCCTLTPLTGTAGVATQTPSFSLFPLGVTSGSFSQILDTSLAAAFNPAYVTANGGTPASAEAALFGGIVAGKAYFNIHTTAFPGGEIRGFLVPVPEPSTVVLISLGLVGILLLGRNRYAA